jgi:hypothetical protein
MGVEPKNLPRNHPPCPRIPTVVSVRSRRAEYRHRDFTAIGTLGVANQDGVMELDLEFATREGTGSGVVV